MRLTCEQHIFTDRLNAYATVAASPGIDAALRRELEPWVQLAPGSDWMVCRSCPIQGGAWMALSFSVRRTGARRSHIAHTFLVDGKSLAAAGSNLPWLALHLPFWSDYRPAPTGIDPLTALEVDLDRVGQLPMLRWLCAISEPGAVTHWQGGLLAALAAGESVRLDFGPPLDLAGAAQRLLGVPAPASADGVTLWRSAGLLSLIPAAFQRGLSMSVNDGTRNDASLVIEPAGETSTRFAQTAAPGYLGHCHGLLERGAEAELVDFLGQIERYLETPSVAVLEAATAYLTAAASANDLPARIERLLRFWDQTPVVPRAALEEALDLLSGTDLGSTSAARLLAATAPHAFSPRYANAEIPARMLDLLLAWQAPPTQRRALLRGLPYAARSALWLFSEQHGQPPACPRTAASLEQSVCWIDALFSALSPPQRTHAIDNTAQWLVDAAWQQDSHQVATLVARLIQLGDQMDLSDDALCRALVERVAPLLDADRQDPAGRALRAILESAIDSDARLHVAGLFGVALASRRWGTEYRQQAIEYVLSPPRLERREIEIRQGLCRAFYLTERFRPDPELLELVHVQFELLSLLVGGLSLEPLGNVPGCNRIALPSYSAWVKATKKRVQQTRYALFHRSLTGILGQLETLDRFCVAVSYLYADPYDAEPTDPLLELLIRLMSDPGARATLIAWFASVPARPSRRAGVSWGEDRYDLPEQRRAPLATLDTESTALAAAHRPGIVCIHWRVSPLATFALFSALIERRRSLRLQHRQFIQEGLVIAKRSIHPSRYNDLADCLDAAGPFWRGLLR